MKQVPNSSFRFTGFFIRESHIVFKGKEDQLVLDIRIEPSGVIYTSLNQFELHLDVRVASQSGTFEAVVKSVSFFDFESDSEEALTAENNFLTVNAPAIIFPYIRAYIGTLTAQSGAGVVLLPAINMLPLAENLSKNIRVES